MSINDDRIEKTLGSVTGDYSGEIPEPQSRIEVLLHKIISGGIGGGGVETHICSSSEINPITGYPDIAEPEDGVMYLVPSSTSGTLYDAYIYSEGEWQQFGSSGAVNVDVDIDIPTPSWTAASNAEGYIANKPSVISGSGSASVVLNDSSNEASGDYSLSEGSTNTSSGTASHAEGENNEASGYAAHTEGIGVSASGDAAHAEGIGTIALGDAQHVFGRYNESIDSNAVLEIVGNGTTDGTTATRSNARTLDDSGNEWLAGSLTLNQTTLTEQILIKLIALSNLTFAEGVGF